MAGGIAVVAVLVVTGLVTWSYMNRTENEFIPSQAGGPAMGDVTGYVGRVDREARTLDISENLLGLRPMSLTVTNDSSIMVRGKQGGLGDLSKDMPVRVFYEVRNDVKYVTSLQVMTEETQTAQPAASDAKPGASASAPPPPAPAESKPAVASKPAEPKPVAEAKPAIEVKPEPKPQIEAKPAVASRAAESKPPAPAPPAPAETKLPVPSKPAEPKPAVAAKPAESKAAETKPPVEVKTPVRPATPPAPTPTPSVAAAPVRPTPPPAAVPTPRPAAPSSEAASVSGPRPSVPSPPTVRPAPADSDDGTAAVDWLLKGGGR
jgi:hypothetical protein